LTCHIGVLVSGRGSNLEALLRHARKGGLEGATVEVVISNKPAARALEVAKRYGVSAEVVGEEGKGTTDDARRSAHDRRIMAALDRHGVRPDDDGLVLLAGYMRLLTREFVDSFGGKILNVHPSLLPAFPGLRAQEQALAYGAKVSGCTVHFVVPDVDAGPIVLQRAVGVREDDTVESLSRRILKEEHRIFPLAVKLYVEGRLEIVDGRRVRIAP
jgi:phosphoribosylglycinamide formyltransferase 1